jgi:hypothetical protein
VVVRPVEFRLGKSAREPFEKILVPGVHAERDLRLFPVAPEMPLPDQKSEEQSQSEGIHGRSGQIGLILFHCHVSYDTLQIKKCQSNLKKLEIKTKQNYFRIKNTMKDFSINKSTKRALSRQKQAIQRGIIV